MKATGIVRRVDYSVIIGVKVKSLEKHRVFADFVQLHDTRSVMSCHHNSTSAVKGGPAAKPNNAKAFIDF